MTTRTDLDRAEAIIANVSETVEELRPWTNLPDEAHSAGSRRLIASQVTSLSNQLEELVGELRPLKSNLETDFQREKNDRLAAVESRERALDDQEEKLRQQQEELQQLQTRSTVASERKDLEKGETQLTRGQGALSESKAALVEQQTKLKRDRSQLAADRAVVAEREKKLAAGKEKLRTAKLPIKSLEEGKIGLAADINAYNEAMTKLDNDKTFWADMLGTYHKGIAQVEAGRALNDKEKKDHEKSVADHAKMVENFNARAARAKKENDDTRRRLDQQSKNIKDMCQEKEADVADRENRVGTREVDVSAREKACTSKEESVKALEGYFDTQAALATQAQKQHSQQMSTLEKDLQRRLDEVRAQDAERTRRETEFRQRESTLNSSDTDPKSAGIDQAKLAEITESLSRLELNLSTCMDGNLVQLEARLGGRIGEVSATAGQLSTTANTLVEKMTGVESKISGVDDRLGTTSSELTKAVEDFGRGHQRGVEDRFPELDRESQQQSRGLKQDEHSKTLNGGGYLKMPGLGVSFTIGFLLAHAFNNQSATADISIENDENLQSQRQTAQDDLTHSQLPSVAAKVVIDLLPKPSHGLVDPGTSILDDAGPPPVVYSRPVRPLPPPPDHPYQPCRVFRQVKMINALLSHGPVGLANVLYDEAEKDRTDRGSNDSNEIIVHDRDDKTFHVVQLLYTLPEDVTISLIQGTLPHDLQWNQKIKEFYDRFMHPGDHPGIYMNTLSNPGEKTLLPGNRDDEGKWLSPSQTASLCDAYQAYVDDTNPFLNDLIDKQFNRKPGIREWGNTDEQKKKVKDFIKYMRKFYCEGIDPQQVNELHRRCPSEVGWAANVAQQVQQHKDNGSTTYCFGFVNAFTRLPKSHGGHAFAEPKSTLLFPIWNKDDTLARVAEILGCLLTGSYIWYGGYNIINAGGFKVQLEENDDSWDTAKTNVECRLIYLKHPDMVEAKSLEYCHQYSLYCSKPQLEQEVAELKKNIKQAHKDYELAEKKYEDARTKLRASEGPYRKAREEHWENLDKDTKPGQEPMGKWAMRVTEGLESQARVKEEIRRRARVAFNSHVTYRPGPAVTRQALRQEEEAQVAEGLKTREKSVDDLFEEYKRHQEARKNQRRA
ncbi:MAG: hypothetical protein LQ338_000879 [Usnochroma carphineum]|nr:MAG: hypothetical protein LQ338_000879 [Usnochroma carphineum]